MKVQASCLALCLVAFAFLATTSLLGPVSFATMTAPWAITFVSALLAESAWWAAYSWLAARLGPDSGRRRAALVIPALPLLLSLPVDAAFILSNRLPYSVVFDGSLQSALLRFCAAVLGLTLLAQELGLLASARGNPLPPAAEAARRCLRSLPGRLAALPAVMVRLAINHPLLAILLLLGAAWRLPSIGYASTGDTDVMLSMVYTVLSWPPIRYFHDYRHNLWVYNHLPLFPLMLAPLYWLLENVFHASTVLGVKFLVALADMAVAVMLYWQAGKRWWRLWGLALAAIWLLAPWAIESDDHPVAVAIAFALAAYATEKRGWLCGLLLGLGIATRAEIAFFALPLALHFATRRGLAQTVAFLCTSATTVAVIAAPFALYDPEAMDFALRRQLQRDAADQVSALHASLVPFLNGGLAEWLRGNSSALAVVMNLVVALVALRDPRAPRVMVISAAVYLLTLPLVHSRYTLFAYAAALFYAARYRNPLVVALALMLGWPDSGLGATATVLLAVGLAATGLLRPEARRRDDELAEPAQAESPAGMANLR